MPKINAKGNELIGTDIQRVSMVRKGAVRVPFRIMKSEEGKEKPMAIDLGKIGTALFKGEATTKAPTVTSVVFAKSFGEAEAKSFVEEIELSADDMEVTDTMIIAKQEEGPGDGDALIKLSSDVAMTVANVKKEFIDYDFESTMFSDVMKTETFFPAVHLGMDALRSTMYNIMIKADSPGEASSNMTKAVSEFGDYLSTLVASLPAHSFKAEAMLVKSDMAAEEEDSKDKKSKTKKEDAPTEPDAADAKAGEGGEEDAAALEKSDATDASTGDADDDPALAALKGMITSMQAALGGQITEVQKSVKADIDALGSRMAELEDDLEETGQKVEKADRTLSRTLKGQSAEDHDRTRERTKKSAGAPPLLDTAIRPLQ